MRVDVQGRFGGSTLIRGEAFSDGIAEWTNAERNSCIILLHTSSMTGNESVRDENCLDETLPIR